ncbi:hypothetical protein [Halarcobacter ebronensis]|uniref:Uncharacterized protein n=1 Tax=Halarcobacter ebronensis TaxID=1462615 RepID=A0A4Q1AK78_9BACT|nr:hypothetical protein [Halarcobacter ebronensis]QKF81253.1 hypothetical protein AEBR_0753 [Halarcobacter ebronensis]RXK04819.1 hypothetical protein CRV07_09525 [Halarcobacter ebronensis]
MKIEEKIVSDLAYDLNHKIVSIVIEELKADTKVYALDERRECLENLWEEYCVVIQDKTQEKEIKNSIKREVLTHLSKKFETLSYYKKIAIWLKTKEGVAWLYEKKDESCSLDDVPFSFNDCKDELYTMIEKIASTYESDTIYRFLNLECKDYKDDFDEDEKDIVYE